MCDERGACEPRVLSGAAEPQGVAVSAAVATNFQIKVFTDDTQDAFNRIMQPHGGRTLLPPPPQPIGDIQPVPCCRDWRLYDVDTNADLDGEQLKGSEWCMFCQQLLNCTQVEDHLKGARHKKKLSRAQRKPTYERARAGEPEPEPALPILGI